MSLLNKDENKTFGAVFRTPVENSKGIPHILEHSVLCGSKKYPIKEPFVELMKGSLNTFLNAFTYPDRTCYPVASTNLQVGHHCHPCRKKWCPFTAAVTVTCAHSCHSVDRGQDGASAELDLIACKLNPVEDIQQLPANSQHR